MRISSRPHGRPKTPLDNWSGSDRVEDARLRGFDQTLLLDLPSRRAALSGHGRGFLRTWTREDQIATSDRLAGSGALSYLESPQFSVSCGVEDNVPKLHGRAGGPARRRVRPRALPGRGCRRRRGCRRGLGCRHFTIFFNTRT